MSSVMKKKQSENKFISLLSRENSSSNGEKVESNSLHFSSMSINRLCNFNFCLIIRLLREKCQWLHNFSVLMISLKMWLEQSENLLNEIFYRVS